MEQRRDVRAGEAGDLREDPPASGIVRHDSHSGVFGENYALVPGEAGNPHGVAMLCAGDSTMQSAGTSRGLGNTRRNYPPLPHHTPLSSQQRVFTALYSPRLRASAHSPLFFDFRKSEYGLPRPLAFYLITNGCPAHWEQCSGTYTKMLSKSADSETSPHSIDAARSSEMMRAIEVSVEQRRNEGAGVTGDPEKISQPTALPGSIPTCENPVTRPGIKPGSPWWEVLGVKAKVKGPRGQGQGQRSHRCIIIYCALWDPYVEVRELENVQRMAARWVKGRWRRQGQDDEEEGKYRKSVMMK
ncbi:hypothetical protein PR048_001724 [Dryococelus australis]|uniref:Uncharacterized protein n=1 Tax=Dryococelus australis TaxID=614101 RepID=A0ABQ9IJL2_9NEOP|nr:hypothetical protein PR048_001724 [Dryococelus australis]